MESFTLEELPLFNGELLSVELNNIPDVDGLSSFDSLSGGAQDEYTWPDLSPEEDLGLPKPPTTEENHETLVKELLFPATDAASPIAVDQLNTDWLDTNIDLIDYLQPEETEIVNHTPLSPCNNLATGQGPVTSLCNNIPVDPSLTQTPLVDAQIPSPTPSVVSADLENGPEVPNSIDMMEVFAKLSAIIDSSLEGLEQPEGNMPCEPILSPMSVEEVESILSSEPTSPSDSSTSDNSGINEDLTADVSVTQTTQSLSSSFEFRSNTSVIVPEPCLPVTTKALDPAPGTIKKTTKLRSVAEPYPKPELSKEKKLELRKERKKQQNKNAALRYRRKKKEEGNSTLSECDLLEARNAELREKVDTMTREIDYLKNLMVEVYKAKGITLPSPQNSATSTVLAQV